MAMFAWGKNLLTRIIIHPQIGISRGKFTFNKWEKITLALQGLMFLEKNSEKAIFPQKIESKKTTGIIRKCSSRAFQRMVMSVGFDNL
jgi:hypothetical protein